MCNGIKKIHLLKVGFCKHPEIFTIKDGVWCCKNFPALVGVIEHSKHGVILFDTGYSKHFLQETKHFPEKIYRWITPVSYKEENSLEKQLLSLGIKKEKVRYVFISHFHGDHIAGLKDFSKATFFCSREGFNSISFNSSIKSLKNGYLPGLIPKDFLNRVIFLEDLKEKNLPNDIGAFQEGKDLFQDNTLWAIPLPGHAKGHWGLVCEYQNKQVFFVGDACWSEKAYKDYQLPHRFAYTIMSNKTEYNNTLLKLHQLSKDNNIFIIPSHCEASYRRFKNEKNHF